MAKIYVADLAAYNAGHLHGAWIEATSDADAMQEAVSAMLATSPVPDAEEFAIHDLDHDGELAGIGEFSGLQAVAKAVETAELIEDELGDDGVLIYGAFYEHYGQHDDEPTEAVERVREAYAGHHDSVADWAENFLEETGGLDEVPENLRNYIDFDAYGRDAKYSGDIFTEFAPDGGVFVFWNH